ncbi:FHA domain-containing protein [Streptomyces sp. HNM0574]|uniref:FHA domain-containing protein n=1 Tax=Streptomyces sp. HNM0574 TaxID=2714954 RepID=UPI00146DBCF5|nr:FHA domain-containing protein [Streptomyces sp. HNM0574]NLU66412.1 FHA domain-containing protein [Streptomyces sp. HNM0574]
MPTCPNGHQSAADDWCDLCGHRIADAPSGPPAGSVPPTPPPPPQGQGGGYGYPGPAAQQPPAPQPPAPGTPVPPGAPAPQGAPGFPEMPGQGQSQGQGYGYPGPVTPPPPVPGQQLQQPGEPCPQCGTQREAQAPFCEQCRYNFLTNTPTNFAPPPPQQGQQPGFPPPGQPGQMGQPGQPGPPPGQFPGQGEQFPGQQGQFPGQPGPPSGQFGGQGEQFPGQPGQFPGQPGQPGQPPEQQGSGQFPGQPGPPSGQFPGQPGQPVPPQAPFPGYQEGGPEQQFDYEASRPSQMNRPAEPLVPEQQEQPGPYGDPNQQSFGQGFQQAPHPQQAPPAPYPPQQPQSPPSGDWPLPPPGTPQAPDGIPQQQDGFAQQPEGFPQQGTPPEGQPGAGWTAVVAPDHEYFAAMMERSGPEAASLNLPAYTEQQQLPLTGHQITIGRRRQSTGESPDIDLARSPEDPGVSHQHAVLVQQPDGSWSVVDQDSTNGTTINNADEPIQPFVPVPLMEGDRVHVGAWTTITLHRS